MKYRILYLFVLLFFFVNNEYFTFKLSQSTADLTIFTTTPANKIFKQSPVPTRLGSEIKVYCSKHEYEPFKVIIRPTVTQQVKVTLPSFSNPKIKITLHEVKFVDIKVASDNSGGTGLWPDPLWPLNDGDNVQINSNENTAFWITIYVPIKGVTGGQDYTGTLTLNSISIPIVLHVFDFELPKDLHLKIDVGAHRPITPYSYGVLGPNGDLTYADYTSEDWERYYMYMNLTSMEMIKHRLQTSYVSPGSFQQQLYHGPRLYDLYYDCNKDDYRFDKMQNMGNWDWPPNCNQTFIDGYWMGEDLGFFRQNEFLIYMEEGSHAASDNFPYRGDEFCGLKKSPLDWKATRPTEFNTKYFKMWTALQKYYDRLNITDRFHIMLADELGNDGRGDNGYAWISQEVKRAAPKFKLFLTEHIKSGLYDNEYNHGKVDVWCPVFYQFNPLTAMQRIHYCDEEVSTYHLRDSKPHSATYPYPDHLDKPGWNAKVMAWFYWRHRMQGHAFGGGLSWGKFDATNTDSNPWFNQLDDYSQANERSMWYPPSMDAKPIPYGSNNHTFVPSIRSEIFRDSIEDYEYLWLMNGGKNPDFNDQKTLADQQALKIIPYGMSINNNLEFYYNLRKNMGLYLGGEADVSVLETDYDPPDHARASGAPQNYYINFQDLSTGPQEDPLSCEIDGETNEFEKIGLDLFDEEKGYGWRGEITPEGNYNPERQGSKCHTSNIINRQGKGVFYYYLPNGGYDIEVCVGQDGYYFPSNMIIINGIVFLSNTGFGGENGTSTPEQPYVIVKREVYISNFMVMLQIHYWSALDYLKIEANGKSKDEIDMDTDIWADPPSDYLKGKCGKNYRPNSFTNEPLVATILAVAIGLGGCCCLVINVIFIILFVLLPRLRNKRAA